MAATSSGITYPVAGDFIAPLNAHLQALAETTQTALDVRAPQTSTTYTPTLTGITLGNGTISASYTKSGNLIFDDITITFGSTTAVTGSVTISGLQSAASGTASPQTRFVGTVNLRDTGSAYYVGAVRAASATSIQVYAVNVGGSWASVNDLNSTTPHTWAVGDQIVINTIRRIA